MSQECTKLSASISATCLLSAGLYQTSEFLILRHEILKTVIKFRERNLGDWREGRKGRRYLGAKAHRWQMCWLRPRLTREQEAPGSKRRTLAWLLGVFTTLICVEGSVHSGAPATGGRPRFLVPHSLRATRHQRPDHSPLRAQAPGDTFGALWKPAPKCALRPQGG